MDPITWAAITTFLMWVSFQVGRYTRPAQVAEFIKTFALEAGMTPKQIEDTIQRILSKSKE